MDSQHKNEFIKVSNLTKRYPGADVLALRGMNLSIHQGEFFGLLGPNGCGKTTLISILCGLLKATTGAVSIDGKPSPKCLNEIKPLMGLVPQELALYPTLTIKENLIFFGRQYGLRGKMLKERVSFCLEVACLTKFMNKQVAKYSGGMKRRANLAIGLLHQPLILFLDEPTVNVDPQSREVIFGILKKLKQTGTTIIYTTHYLEEAQQMCDRVAIVDYGKVVCVDTPRNLIEAHADCQDLGDVFMQLTGHQLRE